jgi:transcriptional regulator with XRE-family HTH domain
MSSRLTGEQIRAARALARIDQTELAKRTSLSLETIKRLERIRGPVDGNIRTLNAIIEAFEALEIRFDSSDDGGIGVGKRGAGAPGAAQGSPGADGEPRPLLHRLIYFSSATAASGAELRAVLDDIRKLVPQQNAACGLTGVLLVSDGRFLQVLEGSREAVLQIYGAISTDSRHRELRVIESRAVASRHFPDWSLCCGLFASDCEHFRGIPSMEDGFHPERLSPASALSLLSLVRNLELEDPRNRRDSIVACVLQAQCRDRACADGKRRATQEPLSNCA